jgi:hypothetical protein
MSYGDENGSFQNAEKRLALLPALALERHASARFDN